MPPTKAPAEERNRRIIAEYADAPSLPALAAELGLTLGSLKVYASRLGVKRSPEIMAAAYRKGSANGVASRKLKAALTATPLDAAWRGIPLV